MSSEVGVDESDASAFSINPSDWSYLAEGGFHIILRYNGANPRLQRRILRIGKKSLGHTHAGKGATDNDLPKSGARREFEGGVLIPLLGSQYVQLGEAVRLSRADMDKIHDRCVCL